MLGIIGAMDVEVANIKAKVKDAVETEIAGVTFVCGTIDNVMVAVVQCSGQGKCRTLHTDYD